MSGGSSACSSTVVIFGVADEVTEGSGDEVTEASLDVRPGVVLVLLSMQQEIVSTQAGEAWCCLRCLPLSSGDFWVEVIRVKRAGPSAFNFA